MNDGGATSPPREHDGSQAAEPPEALSIEGHWRELVTAALLGTDRRDPPPARGPLGDLVADTADTTPSERMLAQVAACTAVRRAAILPGPAATPLANPIVDDRPICIPAAVDRWHHLVSSWTVLEDEWMLTLIANGWRLAPELVVPVLRRHRRDPIRYVRASVAAGPLATWLVDQLPDLACSRPVDGIDQETLANLPDLPIPPDLHDLLPAPGAHIGRTLGAAIESGDLGQAHRAVLVNLIARLPPESLTDVANALDTVDPGATGHGLASVLADLASTRHRMLDELAAH